MEYNILNSYDLILLLSAFMALFLAVILFFDSDDRINWYLLSFLALVSIEAFHLFSFYSVVGRKYISTDFPIVFYATTLTFYLKGQALFLYISSQLQRDRNSSLVEPCIHLLPLLVFVMTHAQIFDKNSHLYDNYFKWQADFFFPLTYHATLLCYAAVSLFLIYQQRNGFPLNCLKQSIDDFRKWFLGMFIIVSAYLAVWLVGLFAHLSYHLLGSMIIASTMGKIAIFMNIVILLAIFTMIWNQKVAIESESVLLADNNPDTKIDGYVKHIERRMKERKPYLRPNLNLEALARELELSPRVLSLVLNTFYGMNFYQFLNKYRVEEAKRLLITQAHSTYISTIYNEAGFSSRTTFNIKFKEIVGKTPGEWRMSERKF